jgi:carbon monoxide dehydrogenase subunit G
MPTASGAIQINKPVSEVFNFTADTGNWSKISPSVVSVSPAQKLSKGAKGATVRKMGSRSIDTTYEVMEFDAPRRYVVHFTSKGMEVDVTTECKEVAGGTQLTYTGRFKAKGLMMWLMMPMIAPKVRKNVKEDLQNAKKLLGG